MERKQVKNAVIALLAVVVLIQGTLLLRKSPHVEEPKAESKEAKEPSEKKEEGTLTLSAAAQKNAGLKIESARKQTIQDSLQVTGTVQPNDARVAHVRLLSRGRIEETLVRVGDRVKAGQPLLAYDNIELADLVTQFIKASDARKKGETETAVLKKAYERAKNLTELGALAGAEEERRKAEYENALTGLNSDRAEIARVRQQLARFGVHTDEEAQSSRSIVKAPLFGIVTEVKVATGELKNADEEVFTVADLSTVWVQADVYQRDIATVKIGHNIALTVEAYPERRFFGKISYISDVLDPKTRTAQVRCEVENPRGELRIGMFATVFLPGTGSREVLAVPEDAVQLIEGKPFVFVRKGEDHFEKRAVTLGARANNAVEIKQGLLPEEMVVTQGSYALKSELLKSQIGGEGGDEK